MICTTKTGLVIEHLIYNLSAQGFCRSFQATLKEYNTIKRVISLEEVQERINKFNLTVKGIQQMTLVRLNTYSVAFILQSWVVKIL